MEKCQLCDFETDSKMKLAKHILHTHKINMHNYVLQTRYNNIQPVCSCGCGTLMNYNPVLADFPKYIKKHLHIIQESKSFEEIWGIRDSDMYKKVSKTRKDKFASGEYKHVREAIIEGRKDPELGGKISKGAKGVLKPKPEGFGVGRIQSEETKQKMSDTAMKNILKTGRVKRSLLEYDFEMVLEELNISFSHSFYIPSIKKIYDFYLPEYNIIIEIDGDFWHCNPVKFPKPTCKTQEINLENDKFKSKWAEDNGYKLIRIWENDINNDIQKVKQLLLEATKLSYV